MLRASDLLMQLNRICQSKQKDFTIVTDTMNTNLEVVEIITNDGKEFILIRNKQALPEIVIEKS